MPGLAARRIAADILDGVLHKHRTLDDQLDGAAAHPGLKTLADRDRALMRRLVATILRRLGTLGHLLSRLLDRGIPTDAPRAQSALLIGAAQILWMDVPDHAAVDLSVRLVQSDRRAAKYAGLVNAVLRRCAREGAAIVDEVKSEMLDLPPWLIKRWIAHYGEATAKAMALALGHEPSLDLTVKSEAAQWATPPARRDAADRHRAHAAAGLGDHAAGFHRRRMVGAGCRRRTAGAAVRRRRGQDASPISAPRPAARPRSSRKPAHSVTALDRSPARMARLRDNLARLALEAETVVADAVEWPGAGRRIRRRADRCALHLDRHHPPSSRRRLAAAGGRYRGAVGAAGRLLRKAAGLLKSGGTLVYCTCSLEPEEGEAAIAALLAAEPGLRRAPIEAEEVAGLSEIVTPEGDLRTLPSHLPHADPRLAGLDGFYAARLVKS